MVASVIQISCRGSRKGRFRPHTKWGAQRAPTRSWTAFILAEIVLLLSLTSTGSFTPERSRRVLMLGTPAVSVPSMRAQLREESTSGEAATNCNSTLLLSLLVVTFTMKRKLIMQVRKWITVTAGTGIMVLAAAMPATAVENAPMTGAGAGEKHRHGDADVHHPGMAQMRELMKSGNPGMMRMHELMKDGNPGMMRMHEKMAATTPMMSAKSVAGSTEGELR